MVKTFWGAVKEGVIDTSGSWIVKPKYNSCYYREQYNVWELDRNGNVCDIYFADADITVTGLKLAEIITSTVVSGWKGESNYLVDINQGKVIWNQFDFIDSFSEGLAPARKNGEYGFIDITGQWIYVPQFVDARPFSEGLAPVKLNGKWGFIANPLIYDQWIPDEWERGAYLGFYTASDSERTANPDDLLAPIASVLERITHEHIDTSALWQTLNLDDLGISKDIVTLSREDAAVIAAAAAKYCGLDIDCLFAFLEDEDDVDKEKLTYVSWVSCFGLLDYEVPGFFTPKSPVTVKEAQIIALRLYETCLV